MRLYPPFVAVFFLFAAWLLDHIFPVARLIDVSFKWIGVLLAAVGSVLFLWAVFEFKKNGTSIKVSEKPTILVTSGALNFSRNPIYFGFTLILFGIAIWMGAFWWIFPPIAFLMVMNFVQIPKEEKQLEKVFGKQYIGYKKQVRRWL